MPRTPFARAAARSSRLVRRPPAAVPQAGFFALALHLGFLSMYSLVMGSLGDVMALGRLAALRWSLLTFLCSLLLLAWNPLMARLRTTGRCSPTRLFSWGTYLGTFVLLAFSAAVLRSALAPWALGSPLEPRLFAQFAAQLFFPSLAALVGLELFFARRRARLDWLAVSERLERDQERLRLELVAVDDRLRRDASLHLHGEVQSRLLVACALLLRAQAAPDEDARVRFAHGARAQLDDLRAQSLPETREMLGSTESDHLLSHLATRLARRFELMVPVELVLDATALEREERLSPELRLATHYLLEEALINACRHGRPSRIRLRLATVPEEADSLMLLVVEDDGTGFDPRAASKGLGLSLLREDFEREGGRLDVASQIGQGTRVTLRLPLRPSVVGARA